MIRRLLRAPCVRLRDLELRMLLRGNAMNCLLLTSVLNWPHEHVVDKDIFVWLNEMAVVVLRKQLPLLEEACGAIVNGPS